MDKTDELLDEIDELLEETIKEEITLAELIRRGAKYGPQIFHNLFNAYDNGSCALGAAMLEGYEMGLIDDPRFSH